MPLLFTRHINEVTRLGVWSIAETEQFFSSKASVQREISHPQKRLQHLAGRFLLKELFPDFPAEQIAVAPTRKPFLPGDLFHFSISHCQDKAAVCVSRTNRVGVDVETISEKVVRLKHKYLDEAAAQKFDGWVEKLAISPFFSADAEAVCCTLIWSAKEAMFKWYGLGNVDFRKQMHVLSIESGEEGKVSIRAVFMLPTPTDLVLEGIIMDKDVVVWVVT